ncbi:MAG: hypothetical protein ACRDQ4_16005 [Pseudonocardiaceae bacterium]
MVLTLGYCVLSPWSRCSTPSFTWLVWLLRSRSCVEMGRRVRLVTFLVTGLMGRFAYHGVGDNPWRWLWTQGDSGHWGWVKDSDILSDTDPVPVC